MPIETEDGIEMLDGELSTDWSGEDGQVICGFQIEKQAQKSRLGPDFSVYKMTEFLFCTLPDHERSGVYHNFDDIPSETIKKEIQMCLGVDVNIHYKVLKNVRHVASPYPGYFHTEEYKNKFL